MYIRNKISCQTLIQCLKMWWKKIKKTSITKWEQVQLNPLDPLLMLWLTIVATIPLQSIQVSCAFTAHSFLSREELYIPMPWIIIKEFWTAKAMTQLKMIWIVSNKAHRETITTIPRAKIGKIISFISINSTPLTHSSFNSKSPNIHCSQLLEGTITCQSSWKQCHTKISLRNALSSSA